MLEFKLNMYFEEYKDTSVCKTSEFKKDFIKKHGEFPLLNELIIMIQKYQIKKYGSTLDRSNFIETNKNQRRISVMEQNRNIKRFGTKKEREARKKVVGNDTFK